MKAILEFNIDDNADDMALKRCHKSLAMAMVLFELIHNTKKRMFFELCEKDYKPDEVVDLLFDKIHELLESHAINIDELIE